MLTRRTVAAVTCLLAAAACTSSGGDEPLATDAPTSTTAVAVETTDPIGSASGSGSEPGDAAVSIVDFAFDTPAAIAAGTTVVVTNQDTFAHTWTSEDALFDSGTLSTGDTFEFTFEEPGEYSFFCAIHTQMTGSITVED